MTSVASELNALSQRHSQAARNPSGNGQSAETPFAALLDMDVPPEPPAPSKTPPVPPKQTRKPDTASSQRPASDAKDTCKTASEKSATTDSAKSNDVESEDEVQETAADPATEERVEEADGATPEEILTGQTDTLPTAEAQPMQPAAAAQPQATILPVTTEVIATPTEGEIDLLAQAPAQVPVIDPDGAPTDAPEMQLDPSLAAEAGKKADIKTPETKDAAAGTSGQAAAEEVKPVDAKLQQHGQNGEQGKGGDTNDGKEGKVEAKPRGQSDVKPDAPQAQDSAPTKPAADTAQLPHTPTQIHAGATGQAQAASATPLAQSVPVSGLAVEIAAQARAGNNRFEIRLDPAELGRIDVRLDIDREGNVTSRLVIERADTYDLLRRDASTLERALQNAGLKTSDNALEFSLRDQGFAHRDEQAERQNRGAQVIIPDGDDLGASVNPYGRALGLGNGLDIRV